MSTKKTQKSSVPTKSPSVPNWALPEDLRARFAILAEMRKAGVSNTTIQNHLRELWREYSSMQLKPTREVTPARSDATQMVPVSNIQASSMTPNFDTIRSFFLTGQQKHPNFPDWIPSAEIAAPLNLKADQIKKWALKYAEKMGRPLPNNEAMAQVINNGGYFKGVSTLVDHNRLPTLVDEKLGAIAVWYLMEDGKLVWRNYWSPKAVQEIRFLMGHPMEMDVSRAIDVLPSTSNGA